MLSHRSGTRFEDLTYIDSRTGRCITRKDYDVERQVKPSVKMQTMVKNAPERTIISIHNHPESSMPSFADIKAADAAKYKYGLIACHNGEIIKYSTSENLNMSFYQSAFAKYERNGYTEKARKQFLEEARGAGVKIEVLK